MVVCLEGSYASHIKWRYEKGCFRSEIDRDEHLLTIRELERLNVLSDLSRGVRGQSIHAK